MKSSLMAVTAVGGVMLFAGNAFAASEYQCRNYEAQSRPMPMPRPARASSWAAASASALAAA